MQIASVAETLAQFGLVPPDLNVLVPNHDNYTTLLLQPLGDIEADANGVRNSDHDFARRQFSAFLIDAARLNADLAVTPEYSMPWSVLEECISVGSGPRDGALWALGCESIKYTELVALKDRLPEQAIFIFESLDPTTGRFLDPLAYLFRARSQANPDESQLIVLVQFKTCPMGDDGHFEINGLQTGSKVYCFGDGATSLRLATVICSDAFAFNESHSVHLYDRTLLLHIQLNPKPRQSQYRQYRSKMFQYSGDQTEVVCLNWAKDVHENCGEQRKCWNNISGSAWYLRPDKFDSRDETLARNHQLGLYYTWCDSLRCHALYFNYMPACFLITATKVAHIGVSASISRRRGPQLSDVRIWDDVASEWRSENGVDDGFVAIASESGAGEADLVQLVSNNPFAVERVLALCAGRIAHHAEWFSVKNLDSCTIESTEIVRRITACQDSETDAVQFRIARLRSCQRLCTILVNALPVALADLENGFEFTWESSSPHTNVKGSTGRRATVISLGSEFNAEMAQNLADKAADYLGRSETQPDAIIEARQRLHVWYLDGVGSPIPCPNKYVNYDESHSESPFDIARSK